MNPEENKALVMAVIEALNHGQVDEAVAFTHPECTMNGEPFGRDADRVRTQMYATAFPDQVWTLDHMIAEGEWVAARYTFKGTFTEKLGDFPPTGKPVIFSGVTNYHIREGQIVEGWEFIDRLALYQQLGLIPAMA